MIYIKSVRNGQDCTEASEGMDLATLISLREAIGHTNITVITREEYDAIVAARTL